MFFLDVFVKALKPQFDDDSIDRLNYYYTPMLLVIFALTLSAKQYVGQPIQCWIPAQFTGAWEQYSENYCFVQNTYFLPLHHYIPNDVEERDNKEIGYYQWVPFILGLQAILFYLPALVWRILNWQSGLAVKSLVRMSQDTGNLKCEARVSSIQVVASHIHDALSMNSRMANYSKLKFLHNGSYLTSLYLLIKVFYLVQVFMQFIILNSFLSTQYTFWGFGILRDIFSGREWEESGHFPRVTMCDFEVRVLGNKHRHTVQCVLMINMFNEKVYLFLWWWLLGVGIATLLNLVWWFKSMSSESSRKDFVAKYLSVNNLIEPNDVANERTLSKFVEKGLKNDGVFVCRLLAANAGDLFVTELIASLWRRFLEDEQSRGSAPLHQPDIGFNEDLKKPLR
ncbi:inx-13 [Pristionchus pacificus]|uniref:Innexin n=1 Tax=Pristionchus pacificus TaxID=54126 RepID=A0A2A6CCJ7_PRIPA|nr:inx-13 [Pristionchus pacificus]|eukprot:PDM75914.1 inx-13 [Pristionchus pacificus]